MRWPLPAQTIPERNYAHGFEKTLSEQKAAALNAMFDTFEDKTSRIEAVADTFDIAIYNLDEMKSSGISSAAEKNLATTYVKIGYLAIYTLRCIVSELTADFHAVLRADSSPQRPGLS